MASGERTVRIKFDGSTKGLAKAAVAARTELDLMKRELQRNQAELNRVAGAAEASNNKFSKLAKNIEDSRTRWQRFGLALSAVGRLFAENRRKIASMTGPLVSGAAAAGASLARVLMLLSALSSALALGNAAGSALHASFLALAGTMPLLAAGGFAFAGVLGSIKLGADGAKKAFEALKPTLDTLKSQVSDSLRKGLEPGIKNLAGLLPQLETGFRSVAMAAGQAFTRLTLYLKTAQATRNIQGILIETSSVVKNLGAFLAPVAAAFVQIGATAMPVLKELTAGLGDVGERFKTWIDSLAQSGQLEQFIRNALDGFASFGAVLRDLGGIIGGIFSAARQAGSDLSGTIGPLLKNVNDFVHSADGQTALVGLFQGLATVGAQVGQVLGAVLRGLAPAIPPLAKAFADLATTLSSVLVPVIQFLAPILQNVATFIAQNTSWITPLVAALGIWAAAQWALNIALNANPIGLIILAIGALIAIVATIITYWTPIKDFFLGIFNAIKDAISAAATWIGDRFSDVWDFIKGVWSGVTGWFSGVWNGITSTLGRTIDIMKSWFGDAWNWIKNVFRNVGSFFSGVWKGITNGLKSALNWAIDRINDATGIISRAWTWTGAPGIPKIPHLAKGGTAQAGKVHLVGERGPELFVPGQTGRVVSNAQTFGGATEVTLNLDLGEGISERIRFAIDRTTGQVRRLAGAGTGSMA
ncbi:phage tail family protein [Amycolatopsis echigonensis]|uniref:Phage-related protein n=1 Tax=Amycolatopsis echigonensis TaxID=2576905 RepID=A0A8E1VXM2_9PSEU|nr:hypothetical protein [Amycolatopsis echigonensis]MBB2500259.1 hypothetical protein [Amycolatopsis echigonensis]